MISLSIALMSIQPRHLRFYSTLLFKFSFMHIYNYSTISLNFVANTSNSLNINDDVVCLAEVILRHFSLQRFFSKLAFIFNRDRLYFLHSFLTLSTLDFLLFSCTACSVISSYLKLAYKWNREEKERAERIHEFFSIIHDAWITLSRDKESEREGGRNARPKEKSTRNLKKRNPRGHIRVLLLTAFYRMHDFTNFSIFSLSPFISECSRSILVKIVCSFCRATVRTERPRNRNGYNAIIPHE